MNKRTHQALLVGGLTVAVIGLVLIRPVFLFLGLIGLLMGTAGLGIFPRKRLVTLEQQKRVRQLSTYVNAGTPTAAFAVALLGGNEAVFSVALGVTLALTWRSISGFPEWGNRGGRSWTARKRLADGALTLVACGDLSLSHWGRGILGR